MIRGCCARALTAQWSASRFTALRLYGAQSSQNRNDAPVTEATTASAEFVAQEISMLLEFPRPLGTLYRSLSPRVVQALKDQKVTLEQYILRNPQQFALFQAVQAKDRIIMASRARQLPSHVLRGREATPEEIFRGKSNDPNLQAVVTVLSFIPNDWASFADLGIPEEIRVNVMQRKAKAYFLKHPEYFEVQAQGMGDHSFNVRRALSLQKKQQQQQQIS